MIRTTTQEHGPTRQRINVARAAIALLLGALLLAGCTATPIPIPGDPDGGVALDAAPQHADSGKGEQDGTSSPDGGAGDAAPPAGDARTDGLLLDGLLLDGLLFDGIVGEDVPLDGPGLDAVSADAGGGADATATGGG